MRPCLFDGCCTFEPSQHNHVYCNKCRCKRKEEARKKRLESPLVYDEETFQLQENRKLALAERQEAKDKWILENKTFCMFDIETTNLDADVGWILCASFKPVDGETYTIRGAADDTNILDAIRDELHKYDYIVTWYGTRFDLPFVATRLLLNRKEAIGRLRHIDLLYVSRFKFKFFNNKLENVADGLFGGDSVKTKLRGSVWYSARKHDKKTREKAIDYIVEHCEMDVVELENLFHELIPFKKISLTPLRSY
ncbi:hypothetical protein LCGC14_1562230 [marine sediment metagenome]|uniref:YprB ribonuclease H-like domain-containing protein n=1 Tax=marine sediment metagenome TaxID=412755 RepID=A0A0F9J897_9ZZZZ